MADLVGGQAIFEGVMIRRGQRWVAAARRQDGTIALTDGEIPARDRWWWQVPVVRGALATWESIRVGLAATRWSQSLGRDPDESQSSAAERATAITVGAAVLAVFLVVPTAIAGLVAERSWTASLVEGLCSLALFLAYLWFIGRFPSIRRTFEFHGAEHMTVSAWEHDREISVDASRRWSVRHPRCGTDLLLMVFLVSIVVFRFLPNGFDLAAVISRVLAVPVIAGVAYELLRLGGTSRFEVVRRVLAGPGLAVQRLTTAEPSDDQVEVAVAAMAGLVEGAPVRR